MKKEVLFSIIIFSFLTISTVKANTYNPKITHNINGKTIINVNSAMKETNYFSEQNLNSFLPGKLDLKYYSYNTKEVAALSNGSKEVRVIFANLKFQY